MQVSKVPLICHDSEKQNKDAENRRISTEQGIVTRRQATLSECIRFGMPISKIASAYIDLDHYDFDAISVEALLALGAALKDREPRTENDWHEQWSRLLGSMLAMKRGAMDEAAAAEMLVEAMYLFDSLRAQLLENKKAKTGCGA